MNDLDVVTTQVIKDVPVEPFARDRSQKGSALRAVDEALIGEETQGSLSWAVAERDDVSNKLALRLDFDDLRVMRRHK